LYNYYAVALMALEDHRETAGFLWHPWVENPTDDFCGQRKRRFFEDAWLILLEQL
jgi:hypothetical protein